MMNHRNPIAAAGAVALALVSLGAPDATAGRGGSFAKIRAAANDGNPDAIVAALERAENIPCSSECMTFVVGLLDHESYYVRDGAAWWFARRPAQKAELEERAVGLLATGDSNEARNAADTLARVGHPRVVSALAGAAIRADLSEEARAHAVRALGKLQHRSANPALAAAMGNASAQVRREAVLAWSGILRQEAADSVAPLVSDADVEVRRAASQVVGRFRTAAARAALEQVVTSDADPAARRNAAWALGRIGDAASRDTLTAAATDESSLVRMTAKAALRQLR